MGTEKRERQKAARAARIEAELAAEARAKKLRTMRNLAIVAVLIIAVLFLMSCSSDSSSEKSGGGTKVDAKGCPPASGAESPKLDFTKAQPTCIEKGKTYTAVVKTNLGSVTLALDTKRTPKTVNNFVTLARWRYYDDTKIFRTEKASGIIQTGSPHTQDNTDKGPGYTIPDEGGPFKPADYAPGTIAMANTGQPNSGSAQFFFLANEGGRYLGDTAKVGPSAGSYTVFGKVTKGLDTLVKIAEVDDGSGAPGRDVTIESITIKET